MSEKVEALRNVGLPESELISAFMKNCGAFIQAEEYLAECNSAMIRAVEQLRDLEVFDDYDICDWVVKWLNSNRYPSAQTILGEEETWAYIRQAVEKHEKEMMSDECDG